VKSIKVDVRIIAATNQNLEEKIKERSFREDLFYRLNVVSLKTPNLRDIQEDIPLMARHFAGIAVRELGMDQRKFSAGAVRLITLYHWPGNVRQLQNVIQQLVIFCRDSLIDENEVRNILTTDTGKPLSQEPDYETASDRSGELQFASYREAKENAVKDLQLIM
jgi:DNA-binding NtrC family response regulator